MAPSRRIALSKPTQPPAQQKPTPSPPSLAQPAPPRPPVPKKTSSPAPPAAEREQPNIAPFPDRINKPAPAAHAKTTGQRHNPTPTAMTAPNVAPTPTPAARRKTRRHVIHPDVADPGPADCATAVRAVRRAWLATSRSAGSDAGPDRHRARPVAVRPIVPANLEHDISSRHNRPIGRTCNDRGVAVRLRHRPASGFFRVSEAAPRHSA